VPAIDPACWHRLPEDNDGLEAAAAAYYGNDRLLACPDRRRRSRAAGAFPPVVVACLSPIYEEHPQAWERAGHKLRRLPNAPLARALAAMTPNRAAVQSEQSDGDGCRAKRCSMRPSNCSGAAAG
jgi:cobalamin biosynthetic protein CobC